MIYKIVRHNNQQRFFVAINFEGTIMNRAFCWYKIWIHHTQSYFHDLVRTHMQFAHNVLAQLIAIEKYVQTSKCHWCNCVHRTPLYDYDIYYELAPDKTKPSHDIRYVGSILGPSRDPQTHIGLHIHPNMEAWNSNSTSSMAIVGNEIHAFSAGINSILLPVADVHVNSLTTKLGNLLTHLLYVRNWHLGNITSNIIW